MPVMTKLNAVTASAAPPQIHASWYADAMEHLVQVVQELSCARTLDQVMKIVREAARELTGADGATFVLRDGECCYYAEENAIEPLWKGQRFPMSKCISGWVMMHGDTVFIEDIYKDDRIPQDAYRPTFVKSLAMVPIRKESPIGAIGNYWATNRIPAPDEIAILESLANLVSIALENVDLYTQLQNKVEALEESNEELSRFAWIASHDLKSPLRSIDNLSSWIEEEAGDSMKSESRKHLTTLRQRVQRMERLLDDILAYSQIDRKMDGAAQERASAADLVNDAVSVLAIPESFDVVFDAKRMPNGLPRMPLQLVFSNLIGNAVKHHDQKTGHVWIDASENDSHYIFSIADDGPGVPDAYKSSVFDMFRTLKPRDQAEGSGMGLAFVKKILDVNDGMIELIDREGGRGAVFRFTWPKIMKGRFA